MAKIAAVLTGDIIHSTRASPEVVDETMKIIAATAAAIGDDTRFTRFRGDGWQLYLNEPGECLWACLLIHARLRATETSLITRIAVGIGEIFPLQATTLSSAMGPAFTVSGRGLDQMGNGQLITLHGKPLVDRFQKRVFALASDRAARWTREQAEAVALALDGDAPTRASIAGKLGISRQAVEARLHAAGLRHLEDASQDFLANYSSKG